MPEVKGERFSYTVAGKAAAARKKAALKKKVAKKKKPASKKKAYKTGGLTDAAYEKKMAAYNRRVAEGKRMYLSGAKLRQYTGPKPTKQGTLK
tara:strand:+ start:56 stop:334 length:279 start_codon:yes stop_codon:yes gene_type:complete